MSYETLLKGFRRAPTGATKHSLDDAARKLNVVFPPDYVALMLESNGGEGAVGEEGYLVLWPVEELVSANEGYETGRFFPKWVFIGSDGGGEAVAIMRGPEATVALVPFVGAEEDALVGGHSLSEFIALFATDAIWRSRAAP